MKRTIIYTSLVALILFNSKVLHAQYATSAGIRVGGTTGLTVKQFFTPTFALEGIVGRFGNGYSITGLVEKYMPAFKTEGLYFFYGGGIHVAAYNGNSIYSSHFGREINYYPHNNVGAGLNGIAGLEYRIKNFPLAFSLDMKPFFEIGSSGHTGFAPDPSIGIRYIIH